MTEQEKLEANKELVLKGMELLSQKETAHLAMDMIREDYIQHNPNIPHGRPAIFEFTQSEYGKKAREEMRPSGKPVVIAEGNLVVMMLPRKVPHPTKPGEFYDSYWFDMWRIEDGKWAEHWDGAPLEVF